MKSSPMTRRFALLGVATALSAAALWGLRRRLLPAASDRPASRSITVMISGGLTAAYLELVPEIERRTGCRVVTTFGPSMGTAPDAIPLRLQRGEPADMVIMVASALDDLIQKGHVVAGSRVDLARARIGVAVRAGAARPDLGSAESVKRALLAAKSVAYSDSASGVYVSTVLFRSLGIAEEMKGKAREIKSERVGNVVARLERGGDGGFQQISELLPIAGIDYVGPLPPELQKITVFAAGVAVGAREPEAAHELIRFLSSPAALAAIVKTGLEPAAPEPR